MAEMRSELEPARQPQPAAGQSMSRGPVSRQENGRWSGYSHLLIARMKELYREPEVVFWVFVFPLLLALGLGIAFRNKPAEVSRVVVVAGPGAGRALEMFKSPPEGSFIQTEARPATEAFNQFRLGKYD